MAYKNEIKTLIHSSNSDAALKFGFALKILMQASHLILVLGKVKQNFQFT